MNGPRYDHAALAAITIVNLHLHSDEPKHIVFGKLLFLILDSMYAADAELNEKRDIISRN